MCLRVEGIFLCESALFLVRYVYVIWSITRVQVILSSVCFLVSFCHIVSGCGEIITYLVSCMGISLLPAVGCCGFPCCMAPLVTLAYLFGICYIDGHDNTIQLSYLKTNEYVAASRHRVV
jgi:hypothetical protein